MRVGLLGPVEVELEDGRVLVPAGARPRALLARLALAPGSVLSQAALATALWGDEPPAANALHTVVSRLRRSLASHGEATADLLRSHSSGYALDVPPDAVDAVRAERLAARAGDALAGGDPRTARRLTADALALWRGEPLADVDDAPFAATAGAQLTELRLRLEEQAVAAALELGDDVDLPDLEQRALDHPLRERLQVLLVRALYAAGRQADALAAYQRTRRLLTDELGLDPSPELEETHLAVLRQDSDIRARPRPAAPPRSRLPTQITSFVGRQRELADVTAALAASRLVTVVGPGGAGKTRLATEAARQVEHESPGGVYLVELAPVQDPAELPSFVLGTLGLRERPLFSIDGEPPPVREAVDRLVDGLASAEVLLVLDNCEHLVAAAADLAGRLLSACPGVRVLATSREPLAITGEQLCPLPPLDVPPPDVTVADASGFTAVRLFADRARAVRPGFTVTADNVAAVAQICRELDGMPLAVELAAARLRTMSAEQVADRLDDRFRLLTAGSRTAMPRHKTLQAVVEWSWELLDKPERLLLARLAVFAGPVTLADIEATCADDELPEARILDVLTALIDKSLVDGVGDGEMRYRLLETVRAYAADRLEESGDAEARMRRHALHVLQVARTAEPLLRTGEQLHWLRRLDGLREDVAAVLRRSVESGDAALGTELVASVGWYWVLRGMHRELRHWPQQVSATPGDADPHDRVLVSLYLAMTRAGDDPSEIAKTADDAVEQLRQLDGGPEHPFTVLLEPMALMFHDEPEESMRILHGIIDGCPDAWTRATALVFRSRLAMSVGDGETAYADEKQLLDAYTELGDRWGLSLALSFAADRLTRAGDYQQALDVHRSALHQMREIGSADDAAHTLAKMAEIHAALGEHEAARTLLRESADTQTTVHQILPVQRAYTESGYAEAALHRGDLDEALSRYSAAVEILETAGIPMTQLRSGMHLGLAAVLVRRGEVDEAAGHLRRAWETAARTTDRSLVAVVVEGWADWVAATGDPALAARLLGMSQVAFGTVRSPNLHRPALVRTLQATLGTTAYAQVYAEGTAHTYADARAWMVTWLDPQDA